MWKTLIWVLGRRDEAKRHRELIPTMRKNKFRCMLFQQKSVNFNLLLFVFFVLAIKIHNWQTLRTVIYKVRERQTERKSKSEKKHYTVEENFWVVFKMKSTSKVVFFCCCWVTKLWLKLFNWCGNNLGVYFDYSHI